MISPNEYDKVSGMILIFSWYHTYNGLECLDWRWNSSANIFAQKSYAMPFGNVYGKSNFEADSFHIPIVYDDYCLKFNSA